MNKGEIVIYKDSEEENFHIDVLVKDETVWLNRKQLAVLFGRDVKTIGKHIGNALKEELKDISVIANFATTASDGKIYQVEHYNLDMIISIGYRVKSIRGVKFRMWANKVLKDYLLKGCAIQNRFEKIEDDVLTLKKQFKKIDFQVKTELPVKQGIFFDGQVFDAYKLVSDIVRSAKKSIVLIDNFVDDTVLTLFSKRKKGVTLKILTKKLDEKKILDVKKFNEQFPTAEIIKFDNSHDRFMIIDEKDLYHFGASLKDLGKKWFAFSKMDVEVGDMIKKVKKI